MGSSEGGAGTSAGRRGRGRRIGIVLGGIAAVIGGAIGAFFVMTPYAPEPRAIRVEPTPELVARGEYLAEHVAHCTTCHSEPDETRFSGPPRRDRLGAGGYHWGHAEGLPGEVTSANITPAGVGEWSDGELERAITIGVHRDGRALVPVMPYTAYRRMCDRDVEAVIAWMRTLAPIESDVPEPQVDFPVDLLLRTMPAPRDPLACPTEEDPPEVRGEYLVTLANCAGCHTERRGAEVTGAPFAGGTEIRMPDGSIQRTPNLTPDEQTGLGLWTADGFVARFAAHRAEERIEPGDYDTHMPWSVFSGMTDDDLRAIFAYLRTVEPVHHEVERYTPPPGARGDHVAAR